MAIATEETTICEWCAEEYEETETVATVTVYCDAPFGASHLLDLCDHCAAEYHAAAWYAAH